MYIYIQIAIKEIKETDRRRQESKELATRTQ